MEFKSYTEKSKAKRALKSVSEWAFANADTLLSKSSDGKWGFYREAIVAAYSSALADVAAIAFPSEDATDSTAWADALHAETAPHPLCINGALVTTGAAPADEAEKVQPATPAAGVFGAIAAQITSAAPVVLVKPATKRTSSASGYTIEKDRPEQNGVKRPSAGGMCRAVWDALDELRAAQNGVVPTVAQAKELGPKNNWNANNVTIEFYNWRKFNGIMGRAAKPATQVAASVEAGKQVEAEQQQAA